MGHDYFHRHANPATGHGKLFFSVINSGDSKENADESEIKNLVRLAREGKHDAFEELVFHYRDNVYATAWHLTHNTEDALDVTQEAFIRAFRAIGSYKGKSQFGTWLHRIVLNTAIDYLRREKRHRHFSTTEDETTESGVPRNEASTPASQRDRIYETELHRRVLDVLAQLSPRQRQVFILRYYQELDTKETAAVLKCTQGSIKRHLSRAQLRLRELLQDMRPSNDR